MLSTLGNFHSTFVRRFCLSVIPWSWASVGYHCMAKSRCDRIQSHPLIRSHHSGSPSPMPECHCSPIVWHDGPESNRRDTVKNAWQLCREIPYAGNGYYRAIFIPFRLFPRRIFVFNINFHFVRIHRCRRQLSIAHEAERGEKERDRERRGQRGQSVKREFSWSIMDQARKSYFPYI